MVDLGQVAVGGLAQFLIPAGEGNGYVTYVDNMGLVYYAPMTLPQGEEPRQESSREV